MTVLTNAWVVKLRKMATKRHEPLRPLTDNAVPDEKLLQRCSSPVNHKVLDTPYPLPSPGCKHILQPRTPSPRKSTVPRNPQAASGHQHQINCPTVSVESGCGDYRSLAAFCCKQIEEEDVVIPKAYAFSTGSLHRAVSRVRDLKQSRNSSRTRHVSLDMDYDRGCSVEGSTALQYGLVDMWGCKPVSSRSSGDNSRGNRSERVESSMGANLNNGASAKHRVLLKKGKDSRSLKTDELRAGDWSSSPESGFVDLSLTRKKLFQQPASSDVAPQSNCCQTYLQINPGRLAIRQDAIECFECTPHRLSIWFNVSHYIGTEKMRSRSSTSPPASDESIFTTSLDQPGVSKDIATKIRWSSSDSSGVTSSGEFNQAPLSGLDQAAGGKVRSQACKQNPEPANVIQPLEDSAEAVSKRLTHCSKVEISKEISPPVMSRNSNHQNLSRSFDKTSPARAKRNYTDNRSRRDSFPVFQSEHTKRITAGAFHTTRERDVDNSCPIDDSVVKEMRASLEANARKEARTRAKHDSLTELEALKIARRNSAARLISTDSKTSSQQKLRDHQNSPSPNPTYSRAESRDSSDPAINSTRDHPDAKLSIQDIGRSTAHKSQNLPERSISVNLKCPTSEDQPPLEHRKSPTTDQTIISTHGKNKDHPHEQKPEDSALSPGHQTLLQPNEIPDLTVNGVVKESVAMVKTSRNPYNDFKESMIEMIVEKDIQDSDDLEELLQCYLSLNGVQYHSIIVDVFTEVWRNIFFETAASAGSEGRL